MPYDPFADVDCRDHPTATPAWYIEEPDKGLFTGPFVNSVTAGAYLGDVDFLVPPERLVHVAARPTCQRGHGLTVTSKATLYNTVGTAGTVVRSVVLADAGDAGNLDPRPYDVHGCDVHGCDAEVGPDAEDLAIEIVSAGDGWSLLHQDDGVYIRMEG